MASSIPLADPAEGQVWSDDEPGLPDSLRLSPTAVADRAELRARVDAAQTATPSSADPGPTAADGAALGCCGARRTRRRPPATGDRAATARVQFESAAWPEFSPPALGTAYGPMAEVMAAERALATATANRAHALSALTDARPATDDRPAGAPGAMSAERRAARPSVLAPVSEWVVRELRVSLAVTDVAAERMLVQSLVLTRRLPGVLAALEGGLIHCGHLPALIELLDPVADDTLRARIEAEVLRWLATRGAAGTITTPAQLRAKIHRVLLTRDARTQAENLRRALTTRGVFMSPEPVPGMSGIHLRMTTAEAAALHAALDQLGADLPDDTPTDDNAADRPRRSRAEKMLDVLLDSVLHPGSTRPPVQVSLTVVAALETLLGGDTPGEIDGHVVPAAQIRTLLDLLTGTHLAAAQHDATSADTTQDAVAEHDRSEHDDSEPGPAERATAGHPAPCTPPTDITGTPTATRPPARTADGERPTLDNATYWAMVGRLIANAPDTDELWWHADDPFWPDDPACADQVPTSPRPSVDTEERTTQHALDAVARAETAYSQLHAALRAADTAMSAAQLAVAHDEDSWQAHHGHLDTTATSLDALRAALPHHTAALHDLLAATHTTAGGGLTHRPRIALTHALTGALISLTDLPGLRAATTTGTDLGPPPGTATYRPTAALDRHVRTRDRRCRTPGCRRPAMTGELDHHIPHPTGPTSASNLCGLCLTDHRGKHQAPGWQHDLHPDGTYSVTTPAGLIARTAPTPVL